MSQKPDHLSALGFYNLTLALFAKVSRYYHVNLVCTPISVHGVLKDEGSARNSPLHAEPL